MTRLAMRLSITTLGAVGFVGLLLAGHFYAVWATPLRILAILWLFAFGALRYATQWRGDRQLSSETIESDR